MSYPRRYHSCQDEEPYSCVPVRGKGVRPCILASLAVARLLIVATCPRRQGAHGGRCGVRGCGCAYGLHISNVFRCNTHVPERLMMGWNSVARLLSRPSNTENKMVRRSDRYLAPSRAHSHQGVHSLSYSSQYRCLISAGFDHEAHVW